MLRPAQIPPRHPSTLEIKLYSPIVAWGSSLRQLQHDSTQFPNNRKVAGTSQVHTKVEDVSVTTGCYPAVCKLPLPAPSMVKCRQTDPKGTFQPSCFTEFHFCVAGLSTCPSQRRNITSPASSWQSVNYTYRLLFGSKSAVY